MKDFDLITLVDAGMLMEVITGRMIQGQVCTYVCTLVYIIKCDNTFSWKTTLLTHGNIICTM